MSAALDLAQGAAASPVAALVKTAAGDAGADADADGTGAPGICIGRPDSLWSPYDLSYVFAPSSSLSRYVAAASSLHNEAGIYVDIYSASVPPLKSGKSISDLYFDGIGTGNRATVARFPNGNDTLPMPIGWIQADGGWPDV